MRVGLFIPCYVNELYPDVAMATLGILESHGYEVEYPHSQSCCGQPFLNSGMIGEAKKLAERFVDIFSGYDYVVAPSSSCIGAVRYRYEGVVEDERYSSLLSRVYELCEFLHDVTGLENLHFSSRGPGRVGLHESCHAIRELELATPSELAMPGYSKIEAVMARVDGLEIVKPSRDECCGFGGIFSIDEDAVSAAMGRDRIADHLRNGVDIVAGVDMSCLMHMEALAKRDGIRISFVHVSQILAGKYGKMSVHAQ